MVLKSSRCVHEIDVEEGNECIPAITSDQQMDYRGRMYLPDTSFAVLQVQHTADLGDRSDRHDLLDCAGRIN